MPVQTNLWQLVDLVGPTPVGDPAPLPEAVRGRLLREDLADLSHLAVSVPQYDGHGFWPVLEDRPTPPIGRMTPAEPTKIMDAEAKAFTLSYAPVNKPVADRWAEMWPKIQEIRNGRVYLPIAPVDVRGDGSLMVQPDIRHAEDRDNLIALHTRSLSLIAAGVTAPVIKFGAADNVEYPLTPAEMAKVAEAPFDRAADTYAYARVLRAAGEAAVAADSQAQLDAFDLVSGVVTGLAPATGWPT